MTTYLNYGTVVAEMMRESEVGASDRKTATLGFGSIPPRQHNDVGQV